MRIIFDTNILIDHSHGYATWLDELLKTSSYELIIPTIVVSEYLTASEIETEKGKKNAYNHLDLFKTQDFTYPIAEILGQILRRKTYIQGVGISDLMIAATTLYLDGFLATRNRDHYKKIPDLRFFDPEKYASK